MKKNFQKLILLLCISFFVGRLNAQVTVTGSTAANGTYTTLGAAFTAINGSPQTGNAILISLTAGTTETATATLNAGAWASVSISATVPVTITGNVAGAIIKLNGADFVTIDGRIGGLGRNISVLNTSTASASAAIWLSSTGVGAGATNNVIRNLEIACGANQNTSTNTTFGIIMSGLTISATSNGNDNDNNTFTENRIIRCRFGIVTRGVTTNNNQNIQVTNNIIGPNSFGADQIGKDGIFMQADFQSAVTGNTVQFVGGEYANTTAGSDRAGIAIGVDSWSNAPGTITSSFYLVANNIVHDIIDEREFSAVGILLGTTNGGAPTSNVVSNNMIYNVKANGTFGDALVGLGISGGFGDQVIHNSIYLYGDVDPNAAATATSMYGSGIRIANASSANHANLTLKYNIVSIDLSSSSTAAARYYAITGNSASYSFGAGGEDLNDYYLNPLNPQLVTGGLGSVSGNTLGTQFPTLTNWKTAYTVNQDAGSFQVNPFFTSTTNLHIPAATNSLLESGAVGSTLTLDYDGDARPGPAGSVNGGGTSPDVGADEFDGILISSCSGSPTASNAIALPTSACSGVNFALSLSVNYTELGYTYQWESSADNVTFSPISGAISATLNTSQTAATYYHCIITCTNSGLSTTSASVQVTMNPFTSCYCTATFPLAVEPITLVNFAGINNSTSATLNGTPATEDFTSITANVTQGTSYPIIVKGNTDGSFTDYIRVFIDFNQNGSFADAGESFDIGTITNSTGIDAIQATANILIPFTSTPGVTRMRVTKLWNAYAASCNAAGYGQAEDYSINIAAAVNCSGTPTPGTISTASLNVCPSSNVNLNLTGQTTDVNITYQWESSSDGVTYTPIGGATNSFYSTTISTVTYFQAVVTCTSSGLSATTPPVQFNINPFTSCYCTATFPSAVEPITLVNFAGINNSTSATLNGTPATEDFTSITATVSKGVSYPIILKGNTDGNFTNYLTVYIDFNQNGSYADLGENFEIGTITNSTGVDLIQLLGNISIPITATTGITGMRVIKKFNSIALPCNAAGFGQAEDYTIDIQPCVPPSSVVLVSDDADATICPNTSVTFTAPTALTYYDFQVNSISVQTGATNTYTNFALANNDVVTVIAGYNATCATTSNSFTILHHSVPVANTLGTDALCNGAANGSIDLTVTGGTPSYIYFWSNFANTQDLAAVAAGTYTVTVIDANGCSGNSTISISEPSAISVSASSVNASCFSLNDGSINITVSGGTLPYTFDWDNDGTGDFNDTEDLASLAAGVYAGVVKDDNGCTASISITITEPTLLVANAVVSNITCFGLNNGSIDITVSGGTTPYTFDWDNDAIGDFDDTEDLNALSSGSYNLVVEDANGCVANSSSTIIEPAILSASVTATAITCNGLTDGELNLTVTGGTIPYSFDWDNDGTGDFNDTEDITGLSAGTYNLVIIDANFCGSVSGGTISEPTAFNVSLTSTNVSCFGLIDGSVDLTVSGATPPYTFDWDNDGTGDFDDTEDLSSIPAGNYVGVVIDANGCTDGGTVTINEPTEIIASISASDITCNGLTDGAIDLTITGGSGIYTIDWDNDGTGDFDDTEDLSVLSAGIYTVVVKDNTNCSVTNFDTIVEPSGISISAIATDVICNGLTDGSIDITISGGSTPFTFDWDNDGTGDFDDTEDLTGLASGTFAVVVNDANGCSSASSSATVNEPSLLSISSVITNANCDNSSDGEINLTITGGTGAYAILWSTTATTEDLTGLADGSYSVTVTDDNGCTANSNETVGFNFAAPVVTLSVTPAVVCNTASAMNLGGESPSGGSWSGTGVTGSSFNPSVAGPGTFTITYTLTDGNGCTNSAQDDIQVDDCSAITENSETGFTVYPNPSLGIFNINTTSEKGNIIVRDAIGKVVYTSTFNTSKLSLDLSSMARGVYYITLETSEGSIIQKIVKD